VEFCEKLQQLRKSRGLTQEELAEALYVSRTAISKWESGRGYPSIDSLKELSAYFSVTIDDLLSAERLIRIAEKESRSALQSLCDLLMGMADLLSVLLIVLPLYPRTVEGYVYSVNLIAYAETTFLNRGVYWALTGVWKILLTQLKWKTGKTAATGCSMGLSAVAVLYLALAGETYAVAVAFLLMLVKLMLLFRSRKCT